MGGSPVLPAAMTVRSDRPTRGRFAGAIAIALAALLCFAGALGAGASIASAADDCYFTDMEGNRLENGDTIDPDVMASGFILYARVPSADDGHGGSIRVGGWLVKYGDVAVSITPDKYVETTNGYYTVFQVRPGQVPNVGDTVTINWYAEVSQTYPTLEGGEPLWEDPATGATYRQSLTSVDPSTGKTYIEVPSADGSSTERVYLKAVTYTESVGTVEATVSLVAGGQVDEDGPGTGLGDGSQNEAGGDQSGAGGGGSTGGGSQTTGGSGASTTVGGAETTGTPVSVDAPQAAEVTEPVDAPAPVEEIETPVNDEAVPEAEAEADEQGLAFTGVPGALTAADLVGLGRVYGLAGVSSADATKGDPAEIPAEDVFLLLKVLSSMAFAALLALALLFGLVYPIIRYRRGLSRPSRIAAADGAEDSNKHAGSFLTLDAAPTAS